MHIYIYIWYRVSGFTFGLILEPAEPWSPKVPSKAQASIAQTKDLKAAWDDTLLLPLLVVSLLLS